jgi:predicted nucleic acid-binding protein
MNGYLLDTGPLAAYLHGREYAAVTLAPWIAESKAVTSILVYGEVTEYLKGLPNYDGYHKQLRELLRSVAPYMLTYGILDRYADIRRSLRQPHGPGLIGDIDTLIAATALEYDLTVVTTNTKHFSQVPGLRVYELPTFVRA